MSTDPTSEHLLARARDVFRAAPEPGWNAIVASVLERVRATPRAGWPIRAEDPLGELPGRLAVSDLVLTAAIARALRAYDDIALESVDAVLDGAELTGVRVELAARFGEPLGRAGAAAREIVASVLTEVIGAGVAGVPVDIVFVDVTERPPESPT